MMILNKNPNFDKGVSKILKVTTLALIDKLQGDIQAIFNFIRSRFPVGSLTCKNILSFVKFLAKAKEPNYDRIRSIF